MRALTTILALVVALLLLVHSVHAAPIQRFQGTILEVGEGFLIVAPGDKSPPKKFLLRWKAQFVPPKLPLKGDHVLVLYKDKEEGAVIYGLHYLNTTPEAGRK